MHNECSVSISLCSYYILMCFQIVNVINITVLLINDVFDYTSGLLILVHCHTSPSSVFFI